MPPTQRTGSLEELGLPDLLASICARQDTGVLSLTRHGLTKSIYIQEGRIVFATSNDPDDRLGELLLCKGMLHIRDFEDASARISQRKRLGAVLVEMGHLKAEELVRAVVEQVKDIVFGLFMWFDGQYAFAAGELPSREVITLKLSTPEVILGGILRIDRWSRVLRGLGGLDTVFRAGSTRDRILQQMQLREVHASVLKALASPHSVRDLCRMGLTADFDVCRTLWAFRVIGLVEAAPAGARARPAAVPRPAAPPAAAQSRPPAAAAPSRPAAAAAPARPAPAAAQSRPPAAAAPSRPAPAPRPAAAAELDPLEAALGDDSSADSLANSMTMSMPAAAADDGEPVLEVVEEGGGGEETLEIVEEDGASGEDSLEIVDMDGGPAGPAAQAQSVDALDEVEVEAAIASFNDRQRHLVALVRKNGGPKTAAVIRRALSLIERDTPGLFSGLEPGPDGAFDSEALKTNIFAFGVLAYAAGLDALVQREVEAAGAVLGNEARQRIASEIKSVTV